MYNIIIEDNKPKMSIVGKIIKGKNFIDYSEIIFTIDLRNDLFNKTTLSKKQIENNSEITEINFYGYNNEEIYFFNLNHLANLICINFIDLKSPYLPNELFTLTNLKELSISTHNFDIFNYEEKKIDINNINSLENLINLEYLSLNANIKKFPKCILSMKKLKSLTINANKNLLIPKEICNLKKLMYINILPYCQNIFLNNNKMLILNLYEKIKIPEEITELKILNVLFSNLDNLPMELEKLYLGFNVSYPLNNLPILLKKIYVKKQNENIYKIVKEKIKLPFDCKLKILI